MTNLRLHEDNREPGRNALPQGTRVMSKWISWNCSACGASHPIQRHEVSSPNREALLCPDCGSELIAWNGRMFYTLGITEPKPMPDPRSESEANDSAI